MDFFDYTTQLLISINSINQVVYQLVNDSLLWLMKERMCLKRGQVVQALCIASCEQWAGRPEGAGIIVVLTENTFVELCLLSSLSLFFFSLSL